MFCFLLNNKYLNLIVWKFWKSDSPPSLGPAVFFYFLIIVLYLCCQGSQHNIHIKILSGLILPLGMHGHFQIFPIYAVVFECPSL